jgi:hypothetical protein
MPAARCTWARREADARGRWEGGGRVGGRGRWRGASDLLVKLGAHLGVGYVACLLLELAPNRHRHRLAVVDHPAGERPRPSVLALDGHHLKPARRRAVPRDDWVGCLVGSPLAQQPAAVEPRATDGVARHTGRVEGEWLRLPVARVADAAREPRPRNVGWVGPLVTGAQLAVVGEHVWVGPRLGGVTRELRSPRYVRVQHRLALRILRVVLTARRDVRLVLHGWRWRGLFDAVRGGGADEVVREKRNRVFGHCGIECVHGCRKRRLHAIVVPLVVRSCRGAMMPQVRAEPHGDARGAGEVRRKCTYLSRPRWAPPPSCSSLAWLDSF